MKDSFKYTLIYTLLLALIFMAVSGLSVIYNTLVPFQTGWLGSDLVSFPLLFSALLSSILVLIMIVRNAKTVYLPYLFLLIALFLSLSTGFGLMGSSPVETTRSDYPFHSQRLVRAQDDSRIFVREAEGQILRNLVVWDENGAATFGSGVWDPEFQRILITGSDLTYPLEVLSAESLYFSPQGTWESLVTDLGFLASQLKIWSKSDLRSLVFYSLVWTAVWGSLLICLSFKSWPIARGILLLISARILILVLRFYHYDLPLLLEDMGWGETFNTIFPLVFLGSLTGFLYSLQALFQPFASAQRKGSRG